MAVQFDIGVVLVARRRRFAHRLQLDHRFRVDRPARDRLVDAFAAAVLEITVRYQFVAQQPGLANLAQRDVVNLRPAPVCPAGRDQLQIDHAVRRNVAFLQREFDNPLFPAALFLHQYRNQLVADPDLGRAGVLDRCLAFLGAAVIQRQAIGARPGDLFDLLRHDRVRIRSTQPLAANGRVQIQYRRLDLLGRCSVVARGLLNLDPPGFGHPGPVRGLGHDPPLLGGFQPMTVEITPTDNVLTKAVCD